MEDLGVDHIKNAMNTAEQITIVSDILSYKLLINGTICIGSFSVVQIILNKCSAQAWKDFRHPNGWTVKF